MIFNTEQYVTRHEPSMSRATDQSMAGAECLDQ